jgi:inner membrane protein
MAHLLLWLINEVAGRGRRSNVVAPPASNRSLNMDNIAHSLLGATLAQTGLKRLTPLATATLVIGANLPDVDGVAMFLGTDTMLWIRRGWTHGILALVVLPWVLMGLMVLYDRSWRRRRDPTKEAVKPWPTLGLAYLGVLTHPFLDWLNTYGVRVLMPFDGRWFYGDTLFIIDPWMWLVLAATVVFAHSRAWFSLSLWALFGLGASALITFTEAVPTGAKILWWILLSAVVLLRWRKVEEQAVPWYGRGAVVLLCLYLAAMMGGNGQARHGVATWLEEQGVVVEDMMTGPMPANPLSREVLAVSATEYHFVRVILRPGRSPLIEQAYAPVSRPQVDPIISAVERAESVRGLMNWIRYPHYEVTALDDGYRVRIQDMRYARPGQDARLGEATVRLDADLREVQE